MNSIYLAGPISGLTHKEATDWRDQFEAIINSNLHGTEDSRYIKCLSPMRNKEHLKNKGPIDSFGHTNTVPLSTSRGIMTRDYFDVRRCSLLVVNFLGATEKSIGTIMEVAWAYMLQKPVIVIAEADNVHVTHAMMTEAISYRVDSVVAGASLAQKVLG